MSSQRYSAWGYKPPTKQLVKSPMWIDDVSTALGESVGQVHSSLPFGNGRSYGDSCLNSAGQLVDTKNLDRFISFDRESGLICVEPGISFAALLEVITPHGWFLPVSPGTSQVSVGGAIANDVHGKNHHCDGTFGRFVESLTLLRSTGEQLVCTKDTNTKLFQATIGGLGLTGVITSATIQLLKISSTDMDVRTDEFHGLEQFAQLSKQRKNDYRYTVAWIDCASDGDAFARGIFLSANHAATGELTARKKSTLLSIPFSLPSWLLNRYSIRLFNQFYFYRQRKNTGTTQTQHYHTYFYPLDSISNWNRIYGAGGFYQYQFVVPLSKMDVLEKILEKIVESGMGSFLAVLKEFGQLDSPGLLSFPREGYCLALDFANRGSRTERLIIELDKMVREAGGAAYPAKDRLMSNESFQSYFPELDSFKSQVDPHFSSDFWRRVSAR